jgi:hypothetical protein
MTAAGFMDIVLVEIWAYLDYQSLFHLAPCVNCDLCPLSVPHLVVLDTHGIRSPELGPDFFLPNKRIVSYVYTINLNTVDNRPCFHKEYRAGTLFFAQCLMS